MLRILCFGDSNTWGFNPIDGSRYLADSRWTQVMAADLSETSSAHHAIELIEEGMNGRTTVWDDPVENLMSGINYLQPCLLSHKPVDWVLIMLGTNDLKDRFSVSAFEIARSAGRLVEMVQKSNAGVDQKPPEVLLIAPPPIVKGSDGFGTRQLGLDKSKQFAECYADVAAELGCEFFDASSVISSSPLDGVHFSAESQQSLGKALAIKLRDII